MHTIQAEKLFAEALAKNPQPKCKQATPEGKCHDVQLLQREIDGKATDDEIKKWIQSVAADVAEHEAAQIEAVLAFCARIDAARTAEGRSDLLAIGRNEVVLVRRNPPRIVRTRNLYGELCWVISARVGTRIEPYPRRDPRSSRAIAVENAKAAERQDAPPPRPSELLERLA